MEPTQELMILSLNGDENENCKNVHFKLCKSVVLWHEYSFQFFSFINCLELKEYWYGVKLATLCLSDCSS